MFNQGLNCIQHPSQVKRGKKFTVPEHELYGLFFKLLPFNLPYFNTFFPHPVIGTDFCYSHTVPDCMQAIIMTKSSIIKPTCSEVKPVLQYSRDKNKLRAIANRFGVATRSPPTMVANMVVTKSSNSISSIVNNAIIVSGTYTFTVI